ncbi:MAG: hypothetical protein ABIH24_08370 [Verrucomicrobiota bacterium]
MVLGILSVMVLMAVAFAIAMRTERVAAGNYADSVRARQLVQVGLARALDDLAGKLGTNGLGSAVGGTNYPPWGATNCYNEAYTNTSTNAGLLKLLVLTRENEATNFVPRALWSAATNADYSRASNHWAPVDSLIYTNYAGKQYVAESNRMGRVKYLILNCSGLLDANWVGGQTRGAGTNPTEIAIGNMTEFKNADATDFLNRRNNTDYRYETLHELAVLNKDNFSEYPSNFTVYSYSLPGYWKTNVNSALNCVGTQVNLSGSAADLINRMSEITNAFAHAGFSQFESGVLYSNLLDYVDTDSIPRDLGNSVEAIPMINEVVVSNNIIVSPGTISGNKYKVDTTVFIECWYPFAMDTSENFELASEVAFAEANGIQPGDLGALSIPLGTPLSAGKFIVKDRTCPTVELDNKPAGTINLISTVTLSIKLGAVPVDQVSVPIVLTNVNAGTVDDFTIASAECLDPRFNAYPAQWRTVVGAHTLGHNGLNGTNTWIDSYFAVTNNTDSNTVMFVANRSLLSVAELGGLVYSPLEPWKTVKLYGADCQRVLDVFAIGTNASYIYLTNTVWRGRINPNTSHTDPLTVMFMDMMVEDGVTNMSTPRLSWVQATDMAHTLQNNAQMYGYYTNLSDIGRRLTTAQFPAAAVTELEKESVLRNTVGLLGVRQNLFTIIIEAQVASGGNIPRNPVRQRAVALVWRDPYTGEMFVRSIKWLRD